MIQQTLFLAPPCRDFPLQDNPELDAANRETAAEDVEPMRSRVAAAFGTTPDEISVSLADHWGFAEWEFSFDVDYECYEWNPSLKRLLAYGYGEGADGFLNLFLPCQDVPDSRSRSLNWQRINRFLFWMGFDVEGITGHERIEWMLQMREQGFEVAK